MYRNNYATIEENINRMKSLMGKTTPTEPVVEQRGNIEKVYKGQDGCAYAIVKENARYYLKKSTKDRDLTLGDFEYLGGNRHCKSLHEYNSYNKAEKILKEKLVTIAKTTKNKELIKEETKRIDNNLEQTVNTKEMRSEIDRMCEIMENACKINTTGSTSIVKKTPLTEKVNIASDECGVITDSSEKQPVNEFIGGILAGAGEGIANVVGGVGDAVGNAVDGIGSGVGKATGLGDSTNEDKDEEDYIDLDSEFEDDDAEIDLEDEFADDETVEELGDNEEGEGYEHVEEEMDILHALMDKLESIEDKLNIQDNIEDDIEGNIKIDDDDIDLDESKSGIDEGFLSDKLNTKYNVSSKEAAEKRKDFERAILNNLRNQDEYLDMGQLAARLKAKIDELIADEEQEDRELDADNYEDKFKMTGTDDDRNFKESLERKISKIVNETIETIASDVNKDKFGYTNAEPDSEGRTSFENADAEEKIGLDNYHKDTLDQVKTTTGKGTTPIVDEVEIEIVESKNNKKPFYIVEEDGTVIGKIDRKMLKKI